jgi:hypothetical protein
VELYSFADLVGDTGSLVGQYRYFWETYCFHLHSTRRHNSKYSNL